MRFGNVLGSRGSVIPTFLKQIQAGGPVTVTHPEMRRYFMTIPEAVQLVLQAGALGTGGELFVLDMGEPIKISDLARDIIRLSGLEEGVDISIEYTGVRPGEKLYEEVLFGGEDIRPTNHPKVLRAMGDVPEPELTAAVEAIRGRRDEADDRRISPRSDQKDRSGIRTRGCADGSKTASIALARARRRAAEAVDLGVARVDPGRRPTSETKAPSRSSRMSRTKTGTTTSTVLRACGRSSSPVATPLLPA